MIKLDKGLTVSGRNDKSAVFCRKDQTTCLIALCDELLPKCKQCRRRSAASDLGLQFASGRFMCINGLILAIYNHKIDYLSLNENCFQPSYYF